jgi:hypothetical protein
MATSPCPEKSEMIKKSLIASVLAVATLGAFAQAPANPTAAKTSTADFPVKALDTSTEKREELRKKVMEERKAKHEADKAKREELKAKHAEMKAKHGAERAKHDEAKAAHAKDKTGKIETKGAPAAPAAKQ